MAKKKCPTCGGRGVVRCKQCGGTGKTGNILTGYMTCSRCDGLGEHTCPNCHGTGEISVDC